MVEAGALAADLELRMVGELPAAATLPAFVELRGDASGNLWIRAYPVRGEPARWVVLDPDLEPMARMELPADLRILDIGAAGILSRTRGPLDEPIVEYRRLVRR